MKILTKSYLETINFGTQLAHYLQAGDLILLDGDLGAGKTTLTQGVARGLGIKRPVKSPTFTLIREYQQGKYPLYHMDMYRLENSSAEELGLQEYFNGDGIVIIEWSQFIKDQLPDHYLRIQIVRLDDQKRQLQLQANGQHYQELLTKFD
ncbi:tRNA (adenosine(37)-N6)-threonylcarbamoyltransferase complex ATPase subunit type 1 TsaE [Bombilactobacillus folatiphilus]|uniref:tRNA threonylcarbamoyladenosine biosynthesis protein TsaE n=1 Tax=Bombilactobacillus folatiphilus TaxID=2923362 RepID=A0ABY4P7N7_9LACO|nr:tRNA (adenosine(37)-N6)-threonylcarbamoyltransferase complex ATPase subunit type 1 TsaE [Bombilactobacillus folatiphilus]UQS81653.1 tRNA (adenosine(37)-N6)-threonylcarbamoyltransferase complex ATPase subunit type 1 TsaE [Bombilactobacillus folatiphilus]